MKKKLIAVILAAAMVLTTVACGNDNTPSASESAFNNEVSTAVVESGEPVVEEFSYPMTDKNKISWWVELTTNLIGNFTNLGDTPLAKAITEQTGVEIDYIHPATGQVEEAFGLMLAEGEYPDVIEYNFATKYDGGPEQAIEDGVIIALNDVIDQYCPNLKAYLEANPDIDKMIKTDSGIYYCFPMVMGAQELATSQGLFVRQDWLDAVNEKVPETMDDWHRVLTKFKDELGASSPLTCRWTHITNGGFMYSFGLGDWQMSLDGNGKVIYGALTDQYKEYMMLMKQWYEEGLIDPDVTSINNDLVKSRMAGGQAGANYNFAGSGMQTIQQMGRKLDSNYILVACPFPSNNGEEVKAGFTGFRFKGIGTQISTDCEDVETVARLLDYGYSEEGSLLYNYGIEGTSYEMVNGVPTYTDEVLYNANGWSIGQSLTAYVRATYSGPFVQDLNYYTQYLQEACVKEAPATWTVDTAIDYIIPAVSLTLEESEEASAILTDVNTYVSENIMKFFLGTRSFDEWDIFVKEAESFGIDRAIEIYQTAYDRFMAR